MYLLRLGTNEKITLPNIPKVRLGRHKDCEIQFSSHHVSRYHCILQRNSNLSFTVRSTAANNRTFVDGDVLTVSGDTAQLLPGSLLGLGIPFSLLDQSEVNINYIFLKLCDDDLVEELQDVQRTEPAEQQQSVPHVATSNGKQPSYRKPDAARGPLECIGAIQPASGLDLTHVQPQPSHAQQSRSRLSGNGESKEANGAQPVCETECGRLQRRTESSETVSLGDTTKLGQGDHAVQVARAGHQSTGTKLIIADVKEEFGESVPINADLLNKISGDSLHTTSLNTTDKLFPEVTNRSITVSNSTSTIGSCIALQSDAATTDNSKTVLSTSSNDSSTIRFSSESTINCVSVTSLGTSSLLSNPNTLSKMSTSQSFHVGKSVLDESTWKKRNRLYQRARPVSTLVHNESPLAVSAEDEPINVLPSAHLTDQNVQDEIIVLSDSEDDLLEVSIETKHLTAKETVVSTIYDAKKDSSNDNSDICGVSSSGIGLGTDAVSSETNKTSHDVVMVTNPCQVNAAELSMRMSNMNALMVRSVSSTSSSPPELDSNRSTPDLTLDADDVSHINLEVTSNQDSSCTASRSGPSKDESILSCSLLDADQDIGSAFIEEVITDQCIELSSKRKRLASESDIKPSKKVLLEAAKPAVVDISGDSPCVISPVGVSNYCKPMPLTAKMRLREMSSFKMLKKSEEQRRKLMEMAEQEKTQAARDVEVKGTTPPLEPECSVNDTCNGKQVKILLAAMKEKEERERALKWQRDQKNLKIHRLEKLASHEFKEKNRLGNDVKPSINILQHCGIFSTDIAASTSHTPNTDDGINCNLPMVTFLDTGALDCLTARCPSTSREVTSPDRVLTAVQIVEVCSIKNEPESQIALETSVFNGVSPSRPMEGTDVAARNEDREKISGISVRRVTEEGPSEQPAPVVGHSSGPICNPPHGGKSAIVTAGVERPSTPASHTFINSVIKTLNTKRCFVEISRLSQSVVDSYNMKVRSCVSSQDSARTGKGNMSQLLRKKATASSCTVTHLNTKHNSSSDDGGSDCDADWKGTNRRKLQRRKNLQAGKKDHKSGEAARSKLKKHMRLALCDSDEESHSSGDNDTYIPSKEQEKKLVPLIISSDSDGDSGKENSASNNAHRSKKEMLGATANLKVGHALASEDNQTIGRNVCSVPKAALSSSSEIRRRKVGPRSVIAKWDRLKQARTARPKLSEEAKVAEESVSEYFIKGINISESTKKIKMNISKVTTSFSSSIPEGCCPPIASTVEEDSKQPSATDQRSETAIDPMAESTRNTCRKRLVPDLGEGNSFEIISSDGDGEPELTNASSAEAPSDMMADHNGRKLSQDSQTSTVEHSSTSKQSNTSENVTEKLESSTFGQKRAQKPISYPNDFLFDDLDDLPDIDIPDTRSTSTPIVSKMFRQKAWLASPIVCNLVDATLTKIDAQSHDSNCKTNPLKVPSENLPSIAKASSNRQTVGCPEAKSYSGSTSDDNSSECKSSLKRQNDDHDAKPFLKPCSDSLPPKSKKSSNHKREGLSLKLKSSAKSRCNDARLKSKTSFKQQRDNLPSTSKSAQTAGSKVKIVPDDSPTNHVKLTTLDGKTVQTLTDHEQLYFTAETGPGAFCSRASDFWTTTTCNVGPEDVEAQSEPDPSPLSVLVKTEKSPEEPEAPSTDSAFSAVKVKQEKQEDCGVASDDDNDDIQIVYSQPDQYILLSSDEEDLMCSQDFTSENLDESSYGPLPDSPERDMKHLFQSLEEEEEEEEAGKDHLVQSTDETREENQDHDQFFPILSQSFYEDDRPSDDDDDDGPSNVQVSTTGRSSTCSEDNLLHTEFLDLPEIPESVPELHRPGGRDPSEELDFLENNESVTLEKKSLNNTDGNVSVAPVNGSLSEVGIADEISVSSDSQSSIVDKKIFNTETARVHNADTLDLPDLLVPLPSCSSAPKPLPFKTNQPRVCIGESDDGLFSRRSCDHDGLTDIVRKVQRKPVEKSSLLTDAIVPQSERKGRTTNASQKKCSKPSKTRQTYPNRRKQNTSGDNLRKSLTKAFDLKKKALTQREKHYEIPLETAGSSGSGVTSGSSLTSGSNSIPKSHTQSTVTKSKAGSSYLGKDHKIELDGFREDENISVLKKDKTRSSKTVVSGAAKITKKNRSHCLTEVNLFPSPNLGSLRIKSKSCKKPNVVATKAWSGSCSSEDGNSRNASEPVVSISSRDDGGSKVQLTAVSNTDKSDRNSSAETPALSNAVKAVSNASVVTSLSTSSGTIISNFSRANIGDNKNIISSNINISNCDARRLPVNTLVDNYNVESMDIEDETTNNKSASCAPVKSGIQYSTGAQNLPEKIPLDAGASNIEVGTGTSALTLLGPQHSPRILGGILRYGNSDSNRIKRNIRFPLKEEDLVMVRYIPPRKDRDKLGPSTVQSKELALREQLKKLTVSTPTVMDTKVRPFYLNRYYFIQKVCTWNYDWLKQYHKVHMRSGYGKPPPLLGSKGMVFPTLILYESYKDYYEVFSVLLFYEVWENIYRDWQKFMNTVVWFKCQVDVVKHNFVPDGVIRDSNAQECSYNFTQVKLITLISHVQERQSLHPRQGSLIAITVPIQGKSTVLFGYVEQHSRHTRTVDSKSLKEACPNATTTLMLTVLLSKGGATQISSGLILNATNVSYLKPNIRIWDGLTELPKSALGSYVVKPGIQCVAYPARIAPYIVPELPLNASQERAVTGVSSSVLSDGSPRIGLIHGPPGTGKTRTIVALVSQIYRRAKESNLRSRILLCAPSNAAVDELTRRLIDLASSVKIRLNIVRNGFPGRQCGDRSVQERSLDTLVEKRLRYLLETPQDERSRHELKRLSDMLSAARTDMMAEVDPKRKQRCKDRVVDLAKRKAQFDKNCRQHLSPPELAQRRCDVQREVLLNADVITSTLGSCCNEAISKILHKEVSVCIVDEAGQCKETDTWLPLLTGVCKLVLAGDHMQLPPTVLSQLAKGKNMKQSLFERVYYHISTELDKPELVHSLNIQYRMHPCIAHFPSQHFYRGELLSDHNLERARISAFEPYVVFDVLEGGEQCGQNAGALRNAGEAQLLAVLLTAIAPMIKDKTVGVITPYQSQKACLEQHLASVAAGLSITVNTVDAFQGQEKDIILFSCVRAGSLSSGSGGGIGFLSQQERLNVALTRARLCLVLVGCVSFLGGRDAAWRALLADARSRGKVAQVRSNQLTDGEYLKGRLLRR